MFHDNDKNDLFGRVTVESPAIFEVYDTRWLQNKMEHTFAIFLLLVEDVEKDREMVKSFR